MKSKVFAALLMTLALVGAAQADRTAGQRVDDTTLVTNVKYRLIDAPGVSANRINVETYKGVVSLCGFVESDQQRARALELTRSVGGVREVVDAMVVMPGRRSFGRTIDDQTIYTKLEARLLANEGMSTSGKITIQVREGEVLLGGFYPGEEVRESALSLARDTGGVEKIHDRMTAKN